MSTLVTMGAQLRCSFGQTPAVLMVLPQSGVSAGGAPAANILDYKPLVNIQPFGMCQSPANPMVAAATAAALGVLTPMPCIPMTMSPWSPGNPTVLVGGAPALDSACMLMCGWAGIIQVSSPGQFTVQD